MGAAKGVGQVSAWQPIEAAPKDGAKVLLAWPDRGVTIGRYDDERYHKKPRPMYVGHWRGVQWMRGNQPTYWQPLPEAP